MLLLLLLLLSGIGAFVLNVNTGSEGDDASESSELESAGFATPNAPLLILIPPAVRVKYNRDDAASVVSVTLKSQKHKFSFFFFNM